MEMEYIQALNTVSDEQVSDIVCRELRELNQACVQSGLQMIRVKDIDEMDRMLKSYRRLRRTMADLPKDNTERVFYECGIFNGVYKVLSGVNTFFSDQKVLRENMQSILERNRQNVLDRKHVLDILDYLYKNPNARQGSIAKGVRIAPNHLSQLLNSLLSVGYIERYGKYKDTCYSLTEEGRMDYESRVLLQKRRHGYVIELAELRDKERFIQRRYKGRNRGILKKEDGYGKGKLPFSNNTKIAGYR